MFSLANIIKRRLATKIGDKMEDITAGKNLLDDPSQIGGMIKDSIMNRPTIAAATMSDEEYEEYLRQQMMQRGGMAGGNPYMAPMPALDMPPVGLAPTGGFVGQTPNYLNFAQQSLGGPY